MMGDARDFPPGVHDTRDSYLTFFHSTHPGSENNWIVTLVFCVLSQGI